MEGLDYMQGLDNITCVRDANNITLDISQRTTNINFLCMYSGILRHDALVMGSEGFIKIATVSEIH